MLPRQRGSAVRGMAWVIPVGLMVAACSGSAEPAVTVATTLPSTTTTTTAVETTTTTAAPTTTTSAAPSTTVAPEPPIPDTSGDDWTKIMTELYALVSWLYQNPDPSLVGALAVPEGMYHTRFSEVIQNYVDNGWRDLPGGHAEVREAVLQSKSGGQAVVLVIDDFDGAVTVDAGGSVARETPDRPPHAALYTLQTSEDGWRILAVENLGPVEGVGE
jgi:hypothetical protein